MILAVSIGPEQVEFLRQRQGMAVDTADEGADGASATQMGPALTSFGSTAESLSGQTPMDFRHRDARQGRLRIREKLGASRTAFEQLSI